MKNRIFSLLLCVTMLLTLLPQTALFASAVTSGTCGANLQWNFDETTATLIITGKGTMTDWRNSSEVPWKEFKDFIQTVIFPDGLTSIGSYAFFNYVTLEKATIPNSVARIGDSAFWHCCNLTNVGVLEGVETIEIFAFSGCSSITSMDFGSKLTNIGYNALAYCNSMTAISVDEKNPFFASDDQGVLYNKSKTILVCCPGGFSGSYIIPDTVTTVGETAFGSCKGLTAISIPNSVIALADEAFEGCTGLCAVSIPNSISSIGANREGATGQG